LGKGFGGDDGVCVGRLDELKKTREREEQTVKVPDECIPHLVMLDVKFDPNRNELLRAVGILR
jgi:hypothetical protein